MVAGPEVGHLVTESEARYANERGKHHEQTEIAQTVLLEKVHWLCNVIDNMDNVNPFKEESGDLLTPDTMHIAHFTAAAMVATHYENGQVCFQEFMEGLESEDSKFYEPIKRNNMGIFR